MTPNPPRPTVLVRMADAGDVHLSWRWTHALAHPGVGLVPEAGVAEALAALDQALPLAGALDRALVAGALARHETELALARRLGQIFLPPVLAAQLARLHAHGVRPHVRVQPAPRLAQLPWELLAPEPDRRLLDIADVSVLAPATIVHAPGRVARTWADTRELPVVGVLDPRVPGFRADSRLGSVLGRLTPDAPLARLVADHARQGRFRPEVSDPLAAFRRTDLDRTWLGAALRAGASRLLYVGHVTAAEPGSGQSEHAQLHLACPADAVGFAPPLRAHRPLSAKDLLLGTHTLTADPRPGAACWPFPSRVALIACESGGDLRFAEALGLATAALHGGAELVTATRWTLPTDLAFHRLAGVDAALRPFQAAVCAIDAAHESDDPVRALCDWQRARLAAWRDRGRIEDSPLLWAAFATISA
ncbi:CHAT domain-containing protein [Goodfellowiella coeruleoviolacea]|uniref:CHAT domain-containing protein n=1 Tax=Goodfellowiella coeruleoviolacea TaxID=334858 RepID=A0AAE3KED1_9PSEU|nr:CHAT domain-containing protein [Goodfellowiella coeruleoviolacea]